MRAWTLCKKDLRIYSRDRVGLLLGLGLPLVLAFVFGAAMGAIGGGGGGNGMIRAKLYVEDRDESDASRELVKALEEQDGLRIVMIPLEDLDTARVRVADGNGPAGLVIEPGYGEAPLFGAESKLRLVRDPGKTIEQQIIAGNLLPALFQATKADIGKSAMTRTLDLIDFPGVGRERAEAILDASWDRMDELVEELEADGSFDDDDEDGDASAGSSGATASSDDDEGGFDFASAITEVLGLEVEDVVGGGNAAEDQKSASQSHAVSGIAVMMLLFGLIACGGTLLEEEAEGTLDRLRLVPGRASDILVGKFLFTWIIGLVQLVLLFLVTSTLFTIPIFRAPVALLVLCAAVSAAATCFGIFFAVSCRTRKQLEGLSTIVVLTMSAFGGSWWPLEITPEWYQALGHFTLNAWAMDGYQGLFWYGKDLVGILPEIGVLLGIAAALAAAAVFQWKRRFRIA